MRIDLSGPVITVEKEPSKYDKFVEDFMACWPDDWRQVIVSGYVALMFGRERMTEDVDMLVDAPTSAQFQRLWQGLEKAGFWCLQTGNPVTALNDYLLDGIALRFARRGDVEPNMEVKAKARDTDRYALENRVQVALNGRRLWIGPLEMQVAFKLWLGSDKDLEDARQLWAALSERLNRAEVQSWVVKLGVPAENVRRSRLELST